MEASCEKFRTLSAAYHESIKTGVAIESAAKGLKDFVEKEQPAFECRVTGDYACFYPFLYDHTVIKKGELRYRIKILLQIYRHSLLITAGYEQRTMAYIEDAFKDLEEFVKENPKYGKKMTKEAQNNCARVAAAAVASLILFYFEDKSNA